MGMNTTSFPPSFPQGPIAQNPMGGIASPSANPALAAAPGMPTGAGTGMLPQDVFTMQGAPNAAGSPDAQQMQALMQALGGAGQMPPGQGASGQAAPGMPGAPAPQGAPGQLIQQGNMVLEVGNTFSSGGGIIEAMKTPKGMLLTAAYAVGAGLLAWGGRVLYVNHQAKAAVEAATKKLAELKPQYETLVADDFPKYLTKIKEAAEGVKNAAADAKDAAIEKVTTVLSELTQAMENPFLNTAKAAQKLDAGSEGATALDAFNNTKAALSEKALAGEFEQSLGNTLIENAKELGVKLLEETPPPAASA